MCKNFQWTWLILYVVCNKMYTLFFRTQHVAIKTCYAGPVAARNIVQQHNNCHHIVCVAGDGRSVVLSLWRWRTTLFHRSAGEQLESCWTRSSHLFQDNVSKYCLEYGRKMRRSDNGGPEELEQQNAPHTITRSAVLIYPLTPDQLIRWGYGGWGGTDEWIQHFHISPVFSWWPWIFWASPEGTFV